MKLFRCRTSASRVPVLLLLHFLNTFRLKSSLPPEIQNFFNRFSFFPDYEYNTFF